MEVRYEQKALSRQDKLEILMKLKNDITALPEKLVASTIAQQFEEIFSLELFKRLLSDLSLENVDEIARQLLELIKYRYNKFISEPVLSVYNSNSRVNRVFILIAKSLFFFASSDITLSQICSLEEAWKREAEEIQKGKVFEGVATDEDYIYDYIYKKVFADQTLLDAMSLISKEIKYAGSTKKAWNILINNMLASNVPSRATLIKILAKQVKRENWWDYFNCLSPHALCKIVLDIDIQRLREIHESKPLAERAEAEWEKLLYDEAYKLFQTSSGPWTLVGYRSPISQLKDKIISEHGCASQIEVCALGFALFATYRRVREKLSTYTSLVAKFASKIWMADIPDKQSKIDACDVAMSFCLECQHFSRKALEAYALEQYNKNKFTSGEWKAYQSASKEGAFNVLVATIEAIAENITELKPKASLKL